MQITMRYHLDLYPSQLPGFSPTCLTMDSKVENCLLLSPSCDATRPNCLLQKGELWAESFMMEGKLMVILSNGKRESIKTFFSNKPSPPANLVVAFSCFDDKQDRCPNTYEFVPAGAPKTMGDDILYLCGSADNFMHPS